MAIQEAEDSDNEDESNADDKNETLKVLPMSKRIIHDVKWIGTPAFEYKTKTFYDAAQVGKLAAY